MPMKYSDIKNLSVVHFIHTRVYTQKFSVLTHICQPFPSISPKLTGSLSKKRTLVTD